MIAHLYVELDIVTGNILYFSLGEVMSILSMWEWEKNAYLMQK